MRVVYAIQQQSGPRIVDSAIKMRSAASMDVVVICFLIFIHLLISKQTHIQIIINLLIQLCVAGIFRFSIRVDASMPILVRHSPIRLASKRPIHSTLV